TSEASILRDCDSVHNPPLKILGSRGTTSQTKNKIYFLEPLAYPQVIVIQNSSISGPESLRQEQPVALTIAGFDPSAGAGIAADLKVFAAHNLYGVAAI